MAWTTRPARARLPRARGRRGVRAGRAAPTLRAGLPGVALLAAAALAGCGGGEDAPRAAALPDAVGTVSWTRTLEGAVVPGPVVAADGSVLAASNGGVLHALDPASGKDRWRYDGGGSYGIDLTTSPVQRPDGTILWPGPRERLFAVTAAGTLRWEARIGATPTTPALGRNGTIYVQDTGGTLHALDPDGHERWHVRAGEGASYASPALGADGTIYTTVGRDLVAVRDRGDRGEVAWRFAAQADVEVSPAVTQDGTIVLGTNDAFQYGIAPNGRERWRWRRDVFTYSSPVTTPDGLVRFGDHRGRLVTLDGSTGRVVRVDRGHGQVWGSPAVGRDGLVVFTGHPGEVFGLDRTGRRVLHARTGGPIDATPAIGPDGTVYVGAEDGRLSALRR